MVLELIESRGLTICLDGNSPPPHSQWGYGEEGDSLVISPPLQLGEHAIKQLDYDISRGDFRNGKDPSFITLTTDKGCFQLQVIKVITGDPELEAPLVTLQDGQERIIDETRTYLRAESVPAPFSLISN